MDASSDVSAALLQAGLLLMVACLGHAYAVSHVSADSIPASLRHRVDVCTRVRPLLVVTALAMAGAGLALALS